ncbi:MAG: cytochrome c [Kofleriaceae bacterium]|nr:cytochrome c [Kofleriaceae bacterium]
MSTRTMVALLAFVVACDREAANGQRSGERVYHELCASCHGAAGVPPDGARALGAKDLTAPELHERLTDGALRRQIRDGSRDGRMPAFGGVLDATKLDALVLHVRSLSRKEIR